MFGLIELNTYFYCSIHPGVIDKQSKVYGLAFKCNKQARI